MLIMIAGLILFLGVHSTRMLAPQWRIRQQQRLGEGTWKGLYSLASLLGLALVVWGFDAARDHPVLMWIPPLGMRHAAGLLTLVAFVLFAAAYVPANRIKTRLGHPMVLGVKVWAVGHLLANGMLVHWVLFGSFLIWAVFDFAVSRRRDREESVQYGEGQTVPTVLTVVLGVVAWVVFAFGLHGLLIGIKPL